MGKNYVPRTVKLQKDDDLRLKRVCDLNDVDVSTFMRSAILEKLNSGVVSNIAGKNSIRYNSEKDVFDWIVELDNEQEIAVLRNLSYEFIMDLANKMKFELNSRDEILRKTDKKSIAIPRGLLKR